MVKYLTILLYICFFLLPNISNGNEKNPILNTGNKDILRKYFDEINLIGQANYSFLLWNIYDAQLYSSTKQFNKHRFALILRYNKKITRERLVKETIDDMIEQKTLSKIQIDDWTKIFSNIYKTTQIGSRFLAIKTAENKSIFFFNEKKYMKVQTKNS